MIVLSMMLLDRASIITLRIRLTRMGALLLDEDTFETGTSAAISDHHLLRIVEHLWVIDAAGARVLLLSMLIQVLHLVGHEGLPVLVDAV